MSTNVIISKENLLQGLDKALADYKLAALTEKEGKVLYDYVDNSKAIKLDYQPTVLSPKKFFFPQHETILEYTSDGKSKAKIEAKPTLLFGLRPCDLNGLKILNEAFADDNGDPNYLAKLEKALVIGIDCCKICDKNAFCFKVKSHYARGGYDVMLYELDDKYLIETASDKGQAFVDKYFKTEKPKGTEKADFDKKKEASFGKEKPFDKLEQFPELFEQNKKHPIWDKEGARCLSCGSCIMVCPTCYCFDIEDDLDLNLKGGKRVRKWDACMLNCFATVAGGENFRHSATARLHHRINRKFDYLMKKHGQAVCVGCGRCVRACLADISPKTIAENINGEKK